jgi:hypothetical protein
MTHTVSREHRRRVGIIGGSFAGAFRPGRIVRVTIAARSAERGAPQDPIDGVVAESLQSSAKTDPPWRVPDKPRTRRQRRPKRMALS